MCQCRRICFIVLGVYNFGYSQSVKTILQSNHSFNSDNIHFANNRRTRNNRFQRKSPHLFIFYCYVSIDRMTLLKNNSKKYSSFLVHATEKEHLDLRRELEAQIRVKDEDCRKFQAQLTQLKSTRYIYFNSIFN